MGVNVERRRAVQLLRHFAREHGVAQVSDSAGKTQVRAMAQAVLATPALTATPPQLKPLGPWGGRCGWPNRSVFWDLVTRCDQRGLCLTPRLIGLLDSLGPLCGGQMLRLLVPCDVL